MTLEQRIHSFCQIQVFLDEFLKIKKEEHVKLSFPENFYSELAHISERMIHHNGWFTEDNILYSLEQWSIVLTEKNLRNWISPYQLTDNSPKKTVAIIMAGNIPMVGFHDFISVLITGHQSLVKLSSNDALLLPFFIKLLIHINPKFEQKIEISKGKLEKFDAIIATGSNNTARYFEYYFKNYPHIIRKNRSSIAVLTGDETEKDLENLGEDIFRYFGMGCRNVSKLFIPRSFTLDRFFKGVFSYQNLINNHKYQNNYDYHKAIFLMNQDSITENGFLMLKEDIGYYSPIGSLFYEYYDDLELLQTQLKNDSEKLQCIVGKNIIPNETPFGETQKPKLNQYADGIDTIQFLKNII